MTSVPRVKRSQLADRDTFRLFEQSGCLNVTGFLTSEVVSRLAKAVADYLTRRQSADGTLTVGTGRHMIPLPIDGVFDDRQIYAHAELRPFLRSTLGEGYVLNCFTCVNAEPGAPDQHVHRDYTGLFDDKIDTFCPTFAINLFIPLVPFNSINGTTRMWPGSHRKPDGGSVEAVGEPVEPVIEPGDALLLDYRLRHGGTANVSDSNRPMLCLSYSRDWFFDTIHFGQINPLQINEQRLAAIDEADAELFARAPLFRNR